MVVTEIQLPQPRRSDTDPFPAGPGRVGDRVVLAVDHPSVDPTLSLQQRRRSRQITMSNYKEISNHFTVTVTSHLLAAEKNSTVSVTSLSPLLKTSKPLSVGPRSLRNLGLPNVVHLATWPMEQTQSKGPKRSRKNDVRRW